MPLYVSHKLKNILGINPIIYGLILIPLKISYKIAWLLYKT